MTNVNNRPLLDLMLQRSTKDWGQAPRYNHEYRSIRWPANPVEDAPRRGRPMWLLNIRHDLHRKQAGLWNRGASYGNTKPDTSRRLMGDLKFCISQNIPFKTRTLEYRPRDQWLYILGDKTIKYSLETGKIELFTYSGTYHKLKSFFLRRLGIDVVKKGHDLIWRSDSINLNKCQDLLLNLNEIYKLELSFGINVGTIINSQLYSEFRQTSGTTVNANAPVPNPTSPIITINPEYAAQTRFVVPINTVPVTLNFTATAEL